MTKILVVGQTPPPLHGQAIMIQKMLEGDYGAIQLLHVRMGFSGEIEEVGKLRLRKGFELVRVICRILLGRFVHGARILYYPPAGPHLVPVLRDIAILVATRWAFERTIYHFHAGGLTGLYDDLPAALRVLYRWAYFRPDLAIRVSQHAPEDGKGLEAKREWIVSNGVEDELGRCPAREPVGRSEANILFVGALRESKGVMTLLEACRILRDKEVPFHANLVGAFESPQFESEARSFVDCHLLGDAVSLPGVLSGDEKCAAYASADVFCLPSYYESETFGIVLVEALSFGLPVVATHWRGFSDIVEEGVCGFLVPVRDAVAVAQRLEVLIRDPALRRRMGEQGRERYLERFTVEQYHHRLRMAFEDLVGASQA